ncbi:hypothetical protein [Alcanivorax sp. S71-1-4]|uniref:hypothetical protein n=1 Tax=Alcanivorax sp. S71-1-4 TaxID=1177159 RepID=UPI00135A791B|nr:hypothetical protein [Alcanivorax sp. S71-1-4]
MMIRLPRVAVFCLALAAPVSAWCQSKGADGLPPGAVYRYINAQGNMVMTSMLTPEGVQVGYEVVDSQGRVIKTVPPAPSADELAEIREAREQARREAQQALRDAELMRMYAAPEDAERARDRQISALQLNIDYARGNITQTRTRLEQEISNAARIERSGRQVPENTALVIERYTRQITELETDITHYEQEITKVRESFEPIIERLRVISR